MGHDGCDLRQGRRADAASPAPYRELSADTVGAFAARFLDGTVAETREVGDGNLNRVFRVSSATSSVIVKQALPYLKVAGRQWLLTRERAHIEADALAVHGQLAPALVPRVLHFDQALSAIVFEDLRDYRSWRDLLVDSQPSPGAAEQAGRYCADVLLGTSDLAVPLRQRDSLRRRFTYSELCWLTEDLVFTAPYVDSPSNRYDEALTGLAEEIRGDLGLRLAVAELRAAFITRADALVHGDLHSGSVLIRGDEVRIIDQEFAFFGPFGFDPGLLLANLALSHIAHEAAGDVGFSRLVASYARAYWDAFADQCGQLWRQDPAELTGFLGAVLADAARFAGVEMIRRIVGLAHARDIDSLRPPARLQAQQRAVACGRALVTGPECTSIDELWQCATEEGIDAKAH
jgi:5-methylthioribose kinase